MVQQDAPILSMQGIKKKTSKKSFMYRSFNEATIHKQIKIENQDSFISRRRLT